MGASLPVAVGVLFAAGFYLILSPHLLRLVLGILVLSQAANLLVFVTAGLTRGEAPLLTGAPAESVPEPLSQAMILTAIVIGFAATAFVVVLARQGFLRLGTDDPDQMRSAEP